MDVLIAFAAVILTALVLLPQTFEAIKEKDLSHLPMPTYVMVGLISFLWLLHGSTIRDPAVIFGNIVLFACAVVIIFMKMKKTKKSPKRATRMHSSMRIRRKR